MKLNLKNAFALGSLTLLSATDANAQNAFFPNDATINYAIPGAAYIGFANDTDLRINTNPTSPTVSVVSGGSMDNLFVLNNSTLNFSGGECALLYAEGGATNINSGKIDEGINAYGNSVVNIRGGSIYTLEALDSSVINFFGTGLSASLIDPNFNGIDTEYGLVGTLADGTNVSGKHFFVQNNSNAKVIFNNAVPEPGGIALLFGMATVGAGVLLRKRRK